ncbi:hypothetical protein AK88_02177 [Plasmodium fragile]|uniref:Schizont-infected cell agglutination C-terminal domain-containing protein n=1 Tax=Plasmodium fragile TaxID=5857 RepID=A0A0D9QMC8_PLAFR|nr:uncharacterized protein AK88_02177 [Plasmodium fragile]KJP88230.1 hypothetical protein AK88_02177 [Plasmodium fragile]
MKEMQDQGTMKLMCEPGLDEETGRDFNEQQKDMCELTLIALHFKHGIELARIPVVKDGMDDEDKEIDNYMRCILVNIFMKKIIGMKCLEGPGGQFAFSLAHGILRNFEKKKVGNISCEEQDAREGGVKGVTAEDRGLWQIMERWLEDNRTTLTDGNVGVLGTDCKVARTGSTEGGRQDITQLKKKVENAMDDFGKDMAKKIQTILPHVKTCATKQCVKGIIHAEQKNDSLSTAPKGKGDGQSGPTPGKPAAAKPAAAHTAAKPVAEKPEKAPGATTTTGPGATTTTSVGGGSSGSGGGGGGAATSVAAKPVAAKPGSQPGPANTKTAAGENCDWSSILDEKRKQVYVLRNYTHKELQDLRTVLQGFVQYMDKKDQYMDAFGANCNNTGWNDIHKENVYYQEQTVADVMRCRLMSGALFYANGGNGSETSAQQGRGVMDEKEKQLRCEAANALGYILEKKYCHGSTAWRRGIKYAWKTVKAMAGPGGLGTTGPVIQEQCTECGYNIVNPVVRVINGEMADWLLTQGKIMDKIGTMETQLPCDQDWKVYTQDAGAKHDKGQVVQGAIYPEITKAEEEFRKKTKKAVDAVKKHMDKEIAEKEKEEQTATEAAPKTEGSGEDKTKDKGKATKPGGSQTTKPSSTPSPSVSGTGSTSNAATTPAPTQASKDSPANVSVTFIQDTSSSECSGSAVTVPQPAPAPAPAPVPPAGPPAAPPTTSTPSASGGGPPAAAAPGVGARGNAVQTTQAHNPSVDKTGENGPVGPPGETGASSPVHPVGQPGAPGEDGKPEGGGGGNDDPPPLNPPKPKPNPNPDQSGSSGSFSDADLANGVSGGEGKGGGGAGEKDAGPGAGVGGATRGSSDGGGPSLTPDTPSVAPGLTWDDVKPYTPAIIPAVVGMAVIAFFLWKYFAYLAQRRRTFRTVRDVPSPPLDEEILDHLQRGDLPPPDYGYTLISDTQTASAAERRGQRPPRVNRRTIIELHLEVLNECEEAEWENVKDDYWHIVVEEFMGGTQGHSSFPASGAHRDSATEHSTPHHATTHHSTRHTRLTRDPTETDSCPPNKEDPDPWSCMETIQLQTHPCPPNEDDPDPWRCMENIRLETDACAPHEDDHDPWSCMETMQLETEPGPPNEQDPDAWCCMEHIQLPPDASASNEDNPDPWSCMENIQLATDTSPPNAHDSDPWRCMETIQLETDPFPPNEDNPWNCMENTQFATHTSPPTADDPDAWCCMETIQLATDHSASNEEDRWSCMETIQLDAEQSRAHSDPGDATSHCTHWIPWIDRNKHLLQDCMTQPWFLQLALAWKQYQHQYAADEDNEYREFGEAATLQMKQHAWKKWVAQQHRQMRMHKAEWFQHLLHNVEEETVSPNGAVPAVHKDLEVDKVMAAEDMPQVRDLPESQLHQPPHMTKPLTAKTWMLLLACVIEQCAVESSMHDRELYVDALLQNMRH